MDGASAIQMVCPSQSNADTQPPTPTGFAEPVSDDFPVLHAQRTHGCFSWQSFWNAGSERNGSQSGSSLKSAGVTPELTCERCASTASQVDRLVGHRNFNAQFLSKRSTIDWACFLREAKNF